MPPSGINFLKTKYCQAPLEKDKTVFQNKENVIAPLFERVYVDNV